MEEVELVVLVALLRRARRALIVGEDILDVLKRDERQGFLKRLDEWSWVDVRLGLVPCNERKRV